MAYSILRLKMLHKLSVCNINIHVHVYSLHIPVSSADNTIVALVLGRTLLWFYLFQGEFRVFSSARANH